MFDKGFFGGLFDFDGDGKLNAFERAADMGMLAQIIKDKEETEEDEER